MRFCLPSLTTFYPRPLGDAGSISIMSGLFMSTMLAAAGFALDTGALRLEKQTAQSAVDLAAITAAAYPDRALAAAKASISANKIGAVLSVTVTTGVYTPNPLVAPSARFVANAAPANAVKVRLRKTGKQYFSQIFTKQPMTIDVTGVAATSAEATFSLGSRLASVNGGVPNKLLGGMLGGNVNLSANDYNALAQTDITALEFVDALASKLHITTGSYNDVLSSSATVGDVLSAIATVAGAKGNAQAQTAATLLGSQSNAKSLAIPLSKYISLGNSGTLALGQSSPGLGAAFTALEMINAAATVANGNKQFSSDLAAIVPGLLSLKLDVAIGEPPQQSPWTKVGQPEATLNTAATHIRLIAEVAGTGVLNNLRLKLPILLHLAPATARLSAIQCSSTSERVTVAAKSGAAEAWIGEVSNTAFAQPGVVPTVSDATILNALLVAKITGRSHVTVGGSNETSLGFSVDDISAIKIKSTSASDLGGTLVSSLLGQLQMQVTILGLGLGTQSTMKTLVANTFASVAAPLDSVLSDILKQLGVHIGQADVAVHGVRCDGGVLIN